ncbi:FAD/NAD(P)-binding protein [Nesterenkonia sp. F]|uniref:FAD/NAD(P)-binding protein n=1 Tax=Nesterenkonia sp. F TaxID=795955 RepID=UPI0002D4A5C1|nr:FAD/NAD(P)-binding protein [Nesterenkonia sp. F]
MPEHEVAEQPAVPEPVVRPEGHAGPSEHVVAVVGAGPRGTSFLERLLAHLEELPAGGRSQAPWLRVLVIDSAVHGPGRVWDPEQSPLHLMNTPASYPTVAPVGRTGEQLAPSSISLSFSQWRRRRGLVDEDAPDTDFPRRADYGRYLAEMHRQAVQTLQDRPGVAVESIHASAIALEREDADDAASASLLTLDDGTVRRADSVVLAVGHVPARLNDAGARTASAAEELGLRHVAPAVPTTSTSSPSPRRDRADPRDGPELLRSDDPRHRGPRRALPLEPAGRGRAAL